MALKLITAAVKKMALGGAAGGAAGAAGAAAGKLLSGNQEEQVINASEVLNQSAEQQSQVVTKPNAISTATPEAVKGFAAYLSKEVSIAERVNEEERKDRIYAGLTREDTITTLLKGLKSSAIVLESKAKFAIHDARQRMLENKREADEQKLEGGLGDLASDALGKVADYTGRIKDGVLAALSPFMTPALLFGGAFLAEKMQSLLPERFRETDLETVLNTVDMAADKVASLSATVGLRAMASKVKAAGKISLQNMGLAKPPPAAATAAQTVAGKINPAMSKYQKFLSKLGAMRNWLAGLQKASNGIVAKAAQWIAKLPAKLAAFLKKTMRKVLKWFLIFEAISFMYNSTQAFILGSITKEEWHTRNKEQITKIIRLFGGPFLVMMIFAAAGTVVPVLGNLAGGLGGLIVGILLGDSVFNILKMDVLVAGLYDVFFLGKWSTLMSYIPALIKSVGYELPKMLAQFAFDAVKAYYTAPLNIAKAITTDRIATEEEIAAEYGEDISSAELLFKTGEGIGTDENAILYAFKDIDTPEKYTTFKQEFEEKYLPEYNEGFGRNVDTMEEYLQKELGRDAYGQLRNQVTEQMKSNAQNDTDQLKSFLREVGYEETPTIAGIGEVTDEEYARYQAGELIDVVTKDGKKVLMTEQELRESENVARPFKQKALDRMRVRKRQAAYNATQQQTASEEIPTTAETQEPQMEEVVVSFSEEAFIRNDPENYRKYQDYYNQQRNKFFDEELSKYSEEDQKKRVWKKIAHEKAVARAKNSAAVKFKAEIEAAGAGTVQIKQQQATATPQETVVQGTQETPVKEVVTTTAETVDQTIIPTMQKVGENLVVLNQVQMDRQRMNLPPAGTEGPSTSTTAHPSRSTVDSFIDVAYVT